MNENIKRWRTASTLVAILSDTGKVLLVDQEDTKSITELRRKFVASKLIELVDDPMFAIKLQVNTEEFDLKDQNIACGFDIFIKSNQFPDKNNWYELDNFYYPHLSQIILQNNLNEEGILFDDNGDFNIFYPCVSSNASLLGIISFVSESMEKYSNYNSEAIRKLNVDVKKKTKKWIPGHRYDSASDTIFYLGQVDTMFDLKAKSKSFPETYDTVTYLITRSPKVARVNKISEILQKYPIVDDLSALGIELMPSIPSDYVDSGEYMENDVENFNDFKEILFKNTLNVYNTPKTIDSSACLLLRIPQMSDKNIPDTPEKYKNIVSDFLRIVLDRILFENWDIKSSITGLSSRLLGSFRERNENVDALFKNLLYVIRDSNTQRGFYYPDLFKWLGIDILELIKDTLDAWDPKDLTNTVEKIAENQNYLRKRKIGCVSASILTARVPNVEGDPTVKAIKSLKELYGEGELYSKIRELIKTTIANPFNTSCDLTNFTWNGAKVSRIIILVGDLMKSELSQALKDDIVKHQFCSLTLWIDAGKLPE